MPREISWVAKLVRGLGIQADVEISITRESGALAIVALRSVQNVQLPSTHAFPERYLESNPDITRIERFVDRLELSWEDTEYEIARQLPPPSSGRAYSLDELVDFLCRFAQGIEAFTIQFLTQSISFRLEYGEPLRMSAHSMEFSRVEARRIIEHLGCRWNEFEKRYPRQ